MGRIDTPERTAVPRSNGPVPGTHGIEVVVPFTEWAVTERVMRRAEEFASTLDATVTLVAVHALPYPMTFECPAAVHAHLAG